MRVRTLLLPLAAVVLATRLLAQQAPAEDEAGRYARAVGDAESLERFNLLLEEQIRSQEAEIASINRQSTEIETTAREIQPLMQQMVDTLARFIELDVPFLLEERTARVRELQAVMPQADVPIAEKYRMIIEAYQEELDYGNSRQAYEGRLGTGADARTVEFARIGRVALMYRTLDGSETGYWDSIQKTWVVDASYAEAVEEAIRVARDEGADELLIVPVPAPQEVRS